MDKSTSKCLWKIRYIEWWTFLTSGSTWRSYKLPLIFEDEISIATFIAFVNVAATSSIATLTEVTPTDAPEENEWPSSPALSLILKDLFPEDYCKTKLKARWKISLLYFHSFSLPFTLVVLIIYLCFPSLIPAARNPLPEKWNLGKKILFTSLLYRVLIINFFLFQFKTFSDDSAENKPKAS